MINIGMGVGMKWWSYLVVGFGLINHGLNGALGCQAAPYHADHYDTIRLRYVKCDCACRQVSPVQGECLKCHHLGNPERGNGYVGMMRQLESALP